MRRSQKDPVVPVTITLDRQGVISVSPDPFVLHKHQDQVVMWTCTPKQHFTVEFEKDSPFYESQFSSDHPCSGLARRSLVTDKRRIYKYSVRVGNKVLDPGGGVDK
jgi:hypothetical protein